jgi:Protein of unknown function (DUF1688)
VSEADAAAWLCTADAVRSRAHAVLALAEAGRLAHFTVDLAQLDDAAAYVAMVVRDAYPDLRIPHHARWRHFAAGGVDRWGPLGAALAGLSGDEVARARIELCVVSVLLDAGAGPDWRYVEPGTGLVLARSEGLAVASLRAFEAGLFAGGGGMRVDAAGLARIDAMALARAFQVDEGNPMPGVEGRVALLRRLGLALVARGEIFGSDDPRVGGLFDYIMRALEPSIVGRGLGGGSRQRGMFGVRVSPHPDPLPGGEGGGQRVAARDILGAVLDGLSSVWPERIVLAGRSLGDVWWHPDLPLEAGAPAESVGLVPFHKLSQWLTYSLIEVFEDAGAAVTGSEALTGLPEYRNGGLFLDLDVLQLRDRGLADAELPPGHSAVVEWRALTVALLDRIAPPLRARLGRDEAALPLSRLLEGGTWAAGRRIAAERRADGGPPLRMLSDGTVF